MFNPTNLDEVCVQATHLEERGKNISKETIENSFRYENKGKGCWVWDPPKGSFGAKSPYFGQSL